MKHLLIVMSFCLCLSCSENKNRAHFIAEKFTNAKMMLYEKNPDVIEINQNDVEHIPFIEMSNYIKNIRYIPFFSKEPIGSFDGLAIYNDRVIVLDAYTTNKVFIFDMSGNIVNIIDNRGPGPNEYYGLSDMSISTKDSMIVLNERSCQRMHYYSLDGKFVKKTKASQSFYFETYNDKIFNGVGYGQSFTGRDQEHYHLTLSLYDSILYKGLPFYPIQENVTSHNAFQYNSKGELLVNMTPNDTVYQIINDSTYTAKYVIKQKKSVWSRKNENLPNGQQRDLVKKDDYTYFHGPVLETDNYVFYQVAHGVYTDNYYIQAKSYWYDKRTGKPFSFNDPEPKYSEDERLPCFAVPHTIVGNCFVGIIYTHEIEDVMKHARNGEFLFENEELNNILKDEKNKDMEFLLVMYEFK